MRNQLAKQKGTARARRGSPRPPRVCGSAWTPRTSAARPGILSVSGGGGGGELETHQIVLAFAGTYRKGVNICETRVRHCRKVPCTHADSKALLGSRISSVGLWVATSTLWLCKRTALIQLPLALTYRGPCPTRVFDLNSHSISLCPIAPLCAPRYAWG